MYGLTSGVDKVFIRVHIHTHTHSQTNKHPRIHPKPKTLNPTQLDNMSIPGMREAIQELHAHVHARTHTNAHAPYALNPKLQTLRSWTT